MDELAKELNRRFELQKEYLGDSKVVNSINPLVSVTIATYRHASYIKECLDGILMQTTDFPYEIIIGEDGSLDGTQEICKAYAEKYPDKIRLFLRDRNLSQFEDENGKVRRFNGLWNRMCARGKYIAWCEGDDYWTDPMKLQRQIDFLEKNPSYSMCFHNAMEVWEEKDFSKSFSAIKDKDYNGVEIFTNWIVPTASVVIRKDVADSKLYHRGILDPLFIYGDIVLFLSAAAQGKIRGMKECMSVYRRHSGGMVYTHDKKMALSKIIHNKEIVKVFGNQYRAGVKVNNYETYLGISVKDLKDGNYGGFFKYISHCFILFPLTTISDVLKRIIKLRVK